MTTPISMELLESKLAIQTLAQMQRLDYPKTASVNAARKHLESQGFSKRYAEKVVDACWNELYGA